jgi:Tol biopolymer transport system component
MKHPVVLAGLGLLAACGPGKARNSALPPVTLISPDSANNQSARFSPDGTRLFWWQPAGGKNQLWTAGAGLSNPTSVPVTSVNSDPVIWSPDGTQIALSSSDAGLLQVAVIPAAGGVPRQVTRVPGLAVPVAWNPDGGRLIYLATAAGAGGGTIRSFVTSLSDGGVSPLIPDEQRPNVGMWSPDGSRIGYFVVEGGRTTIWVADSTGHHSRQLTTEGFEQFNQQTSSWWSPDGKELLYQSRRTGTSDIWVVPLDSGTPRQLTRDIRNDWAPRWSPDGRWVAFHSDRGKQTDLWVVSAAGGEEIRVTDDVDGEDLMQWLSGTRLAYLTGRGENSIWALSLADGTSRRLTPDSLHTSGPLPSPDGTHVAFILAQGGRANDIALVPLAGGPMRTLVQGGDNSDFHWSPDGTRLVFTSDRGGSPDIWVVDVAGGDPRQLTKWPGTERGPRWNGDGSAIWFVSDHDSRLTDLWQVPVAGGEPVRVTHAGAVNNPTTAPGRPELFATLLGAGGQIEVVQVTPDGALVPIWRRSNAFAADILPNGDSLVIAGFDQGGQLRFRILPVTGRGEGQIVNDTGTVLVGSSRDWSLVAYQVPNGAVHNLGLLNRKDGTTRRLTTSSFDEDGARFTPDNQTIVFQRSRSVRRIAIADVSRLLAGPPH